MCGVHPKEYISSMKMAELFSSKIHSLMLKFHSSSQRIHLNIASKHVDQTTSP